MLEFVCFVLEGLRDHGPRQVWQRLGGFDSRQAATEAAAQINGLVASRVSPLYRAPLACDLPRPASAINRDGHAVPRFAEISI